MPFGSTVPPVGCFVADAFPSVTPLALLSRTTATFTPKRFAGHFGCWSTKALIPVDPTSCPGFLPALLLLLSSSPASMTFGFSGTASAGEAKCHLASWHQLHELFQNAAVSCQCSCQLRHRVRLVELRQLLKDQRFLARASRLIRNKESVQDGRAGQLSICHQHLPNLWGNDLSSR